LYVQVETECVVQVLGVGGARHSPFAGQGDAVPPVHSWIMSVWHTMVAPQSASVVHDAGAHQPVGAGAASGGVAGAGSATGQVVPAGHGLTGGSAGVAMTT
jgi:hypothetical protein